MAEKTTKFEGSTKAMSRGGFKPRDRFSISHKDPKYRYRLIDRKKYVEQGNSDHRGWVALSGFNTSDEKIKKSGDLNTDVSSLTSARIVGDLIWARMPVEEAEERNQFYWQKGDSKLKTMKNQAKAEAMRDGMERTVEYTENDKDKKGEVDLY